METRIGIDKQIYRDARRLASSKLAWLAQRVPGERPHRFDRLIDIELVEGN